MRIPFCSFSLVYSFTVYVFLSALYFGFSLFLHPLVLFVGWFGVGLGLCPGSRLCLCPCCCNYDTWLQVFFVCACNGILLPPEGYLEPELWELVLRRRSGQAQVPGASNNLFAASMADGTF